VKINSPCEPWKYATKNPTCMTMEQNEYRRRQQATERAARAHRNTATPVDHILRGAAELDGRRYLGDEAEHDDEPATVVEGTGPSAAVALLDTARAAVMDRHAGYGPPREHFSRTVGMVNALFASVLRRPLTVSDWARIMLLDKLARDLGPKPHPDNAVDLAGYAACLAECEASAPPPGA